MASWMKYFIHEKAHLLILEFEIQINFCFFFFRLQINSIWKLFSFNTSAIYDWYTRVISFLRDKKNSLSRRLLFISSRDDEILDKVSTIAFWNKFHTRERKIKIKNIQKKCLMWMNFFLYITTAEANNATVCWFYLCKNIKFRVPASRNEWMSVFFGIERIKA